MFVVSELKKSIKTLEDFRDNLDKIDNITELDEYESSLQRVVFNLQMQANQVAGEIVPLIMERRNVLQTTDYNDLMARVRKIQEKNNLAEVSNTDDIDTNSVSSSDGAEAEPEETKPEETKPEETKPEEVKLEEVKLEEKAKDGGDSNRQRKSNAGNRKPKSSKKAE